MSDSRFLTAQHWARVGVRHHHGICLPLSSIVSHNSSGIGEFLDLIPLIEWLPQTGFDTLQLLPINDTGCESSPYMALSAFALHPIYLSLHHLPRAEEVPGFLQLVGDLKQLNTTKRVCFEEVYRKKRAALALYFEYTLETILEDPKYIRFVETHRSWLTSYSIYRALKEHLSEKPWWEWDPKEASASLGTKLYHDVLCWRAIQYLCFSQFGHVRSVAEKHQILIEGDVPILLNKDSADVWSHPNLFSLKYGVGAPPDMYNPEGQQWGFPLYKWEAHRKSGFAWWKERMKVQELLYHMYRLDHLVGFYRFFAVPFGKKPIDGFFVPDDQTEWKGLGEEILTAIIQATSMLPLAEDLGDVPDIVRSSMVELGIPGLKVLRWERRWKQDQSFIPPFSFSPESVTTVSTHDSSTLAGWWKEDPDSCKIAAKTYGFEWTPTLTLSERESLLQTSHKSGSLFHINLFTEYLDLIPELSWKNPEQDRINLPGTISQKNWTFRTKTSLEDIVKNPDLKNKMKALLS